MGSGWTGYRLALIPWGEYPWAKWAAADPDGTVNVYDAEPYCDPQSNTLIDQWWEHELEGMEWVEVQGIIHGPWRESLRKRPEGYEGRSDCGVGYFAGRYDSFRNRPKLPARTFGPDPTASRLMRAISVPAFAPLMNIPSTTKIARVAPLLAVLAVLAS